MTRSTILPQNGRDRFLFSVMSIGIPFAVVWLMFVVLPYNYDDNYTSVVLWYIVSGTFIFYNIFGNLFLLIRTDASGRSTYLPTILKPGWKYCSICQLNSPPRAYHCHDCDECILKRDHHCKFTGCCVGYHNQRHFIMGVFYIWIGAFYGLWFQWEFVTTAIDVSNVYLPFVLLAPHFSWLFGGVSLWGMIVAILHTFGLSTFFCTLYLLFLQCRSLLSGQTQYEIKHKIKDYDLSFHENIIDVLGSKWFLIWISPHILSPLIGDGLKFVSKKEFEIPKNI